MVSKCRLCDKVLRKKNYYEFKSKSFSSEEIMEKERDLRSIMRLFTKEENIKLFEEAGFKVHDTFFQYYNFVGWVCIK